MFRRTNGLERATLIAAGLLLVYPSAVADLAGLALVLAVAASQRWARVPRPAV
jgi:TRAP-type uncharacterized transport system fused permease subunit